MRVVSDEQEPVLLPAYLVDDSRRGASALEFLTAAQLAAEVDGSPPLRWLCRPVWPADAYGVAAAEHKAGKTWTVLDLAVSVASGTPWLGVYEVERAGPVLAFLGEGGRRKMLRRLRAICEARQLRFEDLPMELCFRAPHLTAADHLGRISKKLAEQRPVLVVIDPLYLAARGAKSSSLYDMGTHLENLQGIVQDHHAALCVMHHWNQTGTGRGAERMSGAGPAEWGRVLVSINVEHRHTDPATKATAVTLGMQFVGDEIPDTELRIRRRVWADDPDDLASPMHYEVERLEARAPSPAGVGGELSAEPVSVQRVWGHLSAASTALSVQELGDLLAQDASGIPLKPKTIQVALARLAELDMAASEPGPGRGAPLIWSTAHPTAHGGEEGARA